MQYKPLGRTGLLVSELCFGTMTFGGQGELWSKIGALGQSEAEDLIRTALDSGINFIDTADVYSEGRSEEITGQALKSLG
ncbi:MAG: aldo/keto reductase, partial [Rhodobacteraceae bacterium]|nr:aldo/keto reductase [Paracoccaceae bacterium]